MGMLNIDRFIASKQIKLLYRILHSPVESCNAICKFWLHKFVVGRCSDVSTLKLNNILIFYRNLIHSSSKFSNNLLQSSTIDEILEQRLLCSSNITFKNKPICFASFLKSNIRTIKDIWTTIENDFKSCNELYHSLNDKRNCISEYARIKKAILKRICTNCTR